MCYFNFHVGIKKFKTHTEPQPRPTKSEFSEEHDNIVT